MAQRRSSRQGSGKPGFGCLLWLAAFSVVFVVFFLNLGAIRETLDRTGFSELMKGRGAPAATPSSPVATEPAAEPQAPATDPSPGGVVVVVPEGGGEPAAAPPPRAEPAPAAKPAAEPAAKPAAAPTAKPSATAPAAAPAKTRVANLYFVRIDDDGVMARVESKRAVPDTGAPLTDAIAALLQGPDEREVGRRLISLVPEGTRLLSARVSGTTAILNFNEAFMYNAYGLEGYAGQLRQVVFTATAFPTVADVQILIEGDVREYLGGEGVYIGRPLSRTSLF